MPDQFSTAPLFLKQHSIMEIDRCRNNFSRKYWLADISWVPAWTYLRAMYQHGKVIWAFVFADKLNYQFRKSLKKFFDPCSNWGAWFSYFGLLNLTYIYNNNRWLLLFLKVFYWLLPLHILYSWTVRTHSTKAESSHVRPLPGMDTLPPP
jgi:hypothetical protein